MGGRLFVFYNGRVGPVYRRGSIWSAIVQGWLVLWLTEISVEGPIRCRGGASGCRH
jgi:hypothetical protein